VAYKILIKNKNNIILLILMHTQLLFHRVYLCGQININPNLNLITISMNNNYN